MKRLFKILMSVLLVLSAFAGVTATQVKAATDQTLAINTQLNDWILDDANNNIYAITADGNLLEISRTTFQVTKTLPLGTTANLSDLALAGNTLYVSMEDQSQVAVIDLTTFTKTKTYSLSQSPYSIEVVDNKLYYAYDQWSEIGVIDLSSGAETFLSVTNPADGSTKSTFYEPDIASNESGILYVAESGNSGSFIYKISLTSNSIVSQSTYDEGYGFPSPHRKVLLNNNDVFYAGKSLSKENLAAINGTYKSDYYEETILAVTDQFVLTNVGIYDRDEYQKVANYSVPDTSFDETSFVLAPSMSEVYVFDANNQTIYKESYNLPTTLPTKSYTMANQKSSLNDEITDWVADDVNGKIYAISKLANKLLTIDMATTEVIQEQSVGSFPSDIDLVAGKLYIADSGSTVVTVVDIASGAQSTITTTQNPYRVATNGNSLFYVTEDQWSDVYKVDLTNPSEVVVGAGQQTNAYEFYEPDLEYDVPNNRLYIGESGSSGSNLYALNTTDLTLTQTDYDNGYGFPNPERKVILDGANLYYAQNQISATDLTNEIHNYGEDIVNTSTDDVISTKGIYAKTDATVKAATFPYDVSQSIINTNGNVFIFVPTNNTIYKFDSVQSIDTLEPANLLGALDANNDFQLTWDPTTADFYQVFYKTSDMSSAEPLTSSQWVDHQFTIAQADYAQWAGKTVTFTVQSVIGSYTSAPVTFTYTFKPKTPTNFTVIKGLNNNLVFNWDPETADYYKLYYKTSTMTDFLPIDDVELLTNQKSLTATEYQQWLGQTVTFAVKAFAGDKVSDVATTDFLVDDTVPVPVPVTTVPTDSTNSEQTGASTPTGDNTGGGTVDGTTGDNSSGTVDEPTDLFNLDNAKIIRSITTYENLYKYKENAEDIALNLHESLINEMNQTGDEGFYIESNLGSFQIPINTIAQFTNDANSYVQVSIEKVPQDTVDDINKIADDHFFELLSQPVDFSVQIVENGTSTTITSYGDQFVERRIPIDDPSDLDNMVVVLLDPITQTYQPVPTTIEQDESGQYWAVFHRNGNSIYALVRTQGKKFTDVQNHWAKNNIEDLAAKMIVRGTSEDEFSPERSVSRAEFATMLTRALGVVQEAGNSQDRFKDVKASNMYRKAIDAASEAGLVKGYSDGTFRPNETISREEMTAMAVRALEWVNGDQPANLNQLSNYADRNNVDDWAKQSLAIAIKQGLIKGQTAKDLAPHATVTRAEAAVVIDRLIQSLKF